MYEANWNVLKGEKEVLSIDKDYMKKWKGEIERVKSKSREC